MSALIKLARKIEDREALPRYSIDEGRVRRVPRVRPSNGAVKRNLARNDFADLMICRPGPLPLPAWLRRTNTVSSRFNDEELNEILAQAKVAGVPVGEWLRRSWLQDKLAPAIPAFNRSAYSVTARIAANLTQIAGHVESNEVKDFALKAISELGKFRISLIRPIQTDSKQHARFVPDDGRRARRGPLPLPDGEARYNVVCLRVNIAELNRLDSERGNCKRGEWIRMCWQDLQTNGNIPVLSNNAINELTRSADQLNKMSLALNMGVNLSGKIEILVRCIECLMKAVRLAKETLQ